MSLEPNQLSRELRTAQSDEMELRRWIIGLSLAGAAIGGGIGLFQTGLIKRLPDPKGGVFNATRVDASSYAYKRLGIPDGFLMMLTYGITAALAAMGGADRARTAPWAPIALAAKTLFDVGTNVKLFAEEWSVNKKLCQYCLAANLFSYLSAQFALPEAQRAYKTLTQA